MPTGRMAWGCTSAHARMLRNMPTRVAGRARLRDHGGGGAAADLRHGVPPLQARGLAARQQGLELVVRRKGDRQVGHRARRRQRHALVQACGRKITIISSYLLIITLCGRDGPLQPSM